jgi:anti-sigma regulatory factor (Ser/Thr protein kinase)
MRPMSAKTGALASNPARSVAHNARRNYFPPQPFLWHNIDMASSKLISLCRKADEDTRDVSTALFAVREFADGEALDLPLASRLGIVVEELVANLFDHAVVAGDLLVTLLLTHSDEGLFVSLDDNAQAFDPREAPRREMPDPDRGGGVGLTLVRNWADIVAYDSAEGLNRLVLRLRTAG